MQEHIGDLAEALSFTENLYASARQPLVETICDGRWAWKDRSNVFVFPSEVGAY
jgi:hypothetical protein